MGERDLMPFGADSSRGMGEGLCYYQVGQCTEVLTHSFGERPIVRLCFPNHFHFLSLTSLSLLSQALPSLALPSLALPCLALPF